MTAADIAEPVPSGVEVPAGGSTPSYWAMGLCGGSFEVLGTSGDAIAAGENRFGPEGLGDMSLRR